MKKNDETTQLKFFPKNKENPFMEKAIDVVENHVKVRKQYATSTSESAILSAVDPKTGEFLGITTFFRQIKVDDDKFVKLYLDSYQSFFDLSTAAMRVFYYITNILSKDKDYVIFNIEDCYTFTKYKSKTTIYKGICELISAKIIARGYTDNIYFVNPMCVFNGNRVNYVTSYITSRMTPEKELDFNEVPLIE